MTSLTLDRPSLSRLAGSIFDAVLSAPDRFAHAREIQSEVEHIFTLSDRELADLNTTREALLRAAARRA